MIDGSYVVVQCLFDCGRWKEHALGREERLAESFDDLLLVFEESSKALIQGPFHVQVIATLFLRFFSHIQ